MKRKRIYSRRGQGSRTKSIRVPEDMLSVLQELARSHGETFNSFVILCLDDWPQAGGFFEEEM